MKALDQVLFLGKWKNAGGVHQYEAASMSAAQHIGEIDGLRAVAVLSVLLFHVNREVLSGGFVGVDVFFVISGYLITRILVFDLDHGRLSLPRFYERRVLRIAPALFLTLGTSAVLFFTVFPPVLSGDLFASLVSALFSYSNVWFYSTVDYFAANTTNPVLHTWSLAVEEQFYFFFPLLLLLMRSGLDRTPKWLIFCVLGLASLGASGAIMDDDQAGAFYLPWLRAWELLVGATMSLADMRRLPVSVRTGLSYLGLAMIGAACFAYHDQMDFPGYAALLPCLGAAAVIAGTGSPSLTNVLLRTRFMRWTGELSYSLYLLHWPILCLAAVLLSLHSTKVQVLVVLLSFSAAWVSWRYVETPFRRLAGRVSRPRLFGTSAIICILLLSAFALMRSASHAMWNSHPEALRYAGFLKTDISFFREGVCFLSPRHADREHFDADRCLSQSQSKQNVLIIGDSHAANIVQAVAVAHSGVNVLQATSAGCKPILSNAVPKHCRIIAEVLENWLPKFGELTGDVVLAARWSVDEVEELADTIAYLHAIGKRVIVYGPTPEYFISVPLILAYEEVSSIPLRDRFHKEDRRLLDERMKVALSGKARYFSPYENLCDSERCGLVTDGVPVFFDRDHLTLSGARLAINGLPLP